MTTSESKSTSAPREHAQSRTTEPRDGGGGGGEGGADRGRARSGPDLSQEDAVAFCFEELQDMEDSCHDEHILLLPSQLNPCQQESNRMQAGMESAPSWVWWPDQDVQLWLR